MNWVFFLISAVFGLGVTVHADGEYDPVVLVLFIVVMLQALFFAFFGRTSGVSLLRIYGLFTYFFLFLIPVLEFKRSIIYWGGSDLSASDYIPAICTVILANTIVWMSYAISFNLRRNKKYQALDNPIRLRSPFAANLVTLFSVSFSIICFLTFLSYKGWDIFSLFYKGGEAQDISGPAYLFNEIFVRFFPAVLFTFIAFRYEGFKKTKLFCLIISVLLAFPTGISRLFVPAIYLPITLYYVPSLSKGIRFPIVMVLGVLFIFPFLEIFRNFNEKEGISLAPSIDFFLEGHFDSFQSLVRVISLDLITWGNQAAGVLLFFIPRSWWPDKPVGTGALLAERDGYFFSNVSANFLAEGFVNFGFMGVIAFSSVLGFLLGHFDRQFGTNLLRKSSLYPLYVIFCGYLFFFLRGDLMSAYAYLLSLICSFMLIRTVFERFLEKFSIKAAKWRP